MDKKEALNEKETRVALQISKILKTEDCFIQASMVATEFGNRFQVNVRANEPVKQDEQPKQSE